MASAALTALKDASYDDSARAIAAYIKVWKVVVIVITSIGVVFFQIIRSSTLSRSISGSNSSRIST